ncbi:hypothetical protein GHL01_00475 [Sinorhizobium meliloti]|uniref:hypothetical protein n=1 Tax=Rhizobium meliloti TaxID=382 RepID=UPI001294E478|nr:hypothetical protein [Sinorhizobium meliloti]MQV12220.1 hypothetical protein [Sinorhizobium meliloti]
MALVRRPKRVKTGPNSYQNYNSKGQQTSSSLKINGGTYTVKKNGQVRQTHNLGNGYSSVTESKAPRKIPKTKKFKAPKTVRLSKNGKSGDADFIALISGIFAVLFFVVRGLFLGLAFVFQKLAKR